jgi:hypothetical protein
MTTKPYSTDLTQSDNALYWAAVLAQAVRDSNAARVDEAQRNLKRLGVPLTVGSRRKAVTRG